MTRKAWILAAAAGALIVGSIVALMLMTGEADYKPMMGPVAIVQGPLPKNGFLGVQFASSATGAATIQDVLPGSGAAEAGLKPGDVIVAIGDAKDPDAATVKRISEKTKPGDVLPLRVRRGDAEHDVSVRLISIEEFLRLDGARRDRSRTTAPTSAD